MAWFAFSKSKVNYKLLLAWNLICLGLLSIIVTTAVLAIPTPFQQIGLDQPNIAVLYFPFNLLPGFIVPLVLFAHLQSIKLIVKELRKHQA